MWPCIGTVSETNTTLNTYLFDSDTVYQLHRVKLPVHTTFEALFSDRIIIF